jgi:hypothetical protein
MDPMLLDFSACIALVAPLDARFGDRNVGMARHTAARFDRLNSSGVILGVYRLPPSENMGRNSRKFNKRILGLCTGRGSYSRFKHLLQRRGFLNPAQPTEPFIFEGIEQATVCCPENAIQALCQSQIVGLT